LDQDDEYKPQSFAKVQDATLKPAEIGGLKPDPSGIDGEKSKQSSANASAMVKELDGMNKYLQGVRIPGAVMNQGAHLSYTLKGMRNDERINQLYQMAPVPAQNSAPPSKKSESGIAPTEIIDEMYQNIDDFENKL